MTCCDDDFWFSIIYHRRAPVLSMTFDNDSGNNFSQLLLLHNTKMDHHQRANGNVLYSVHQLCTEIFRAVHPSILLVVLQAIDKAVPYGVEVKMTLSSAVAATAGALALAVVWEKLHDQHQVD